MSTRPLQGQQYYEMALHIKTVLESERWIVASVQVIGHIPTCLYNMFFFQFSCLDGTSGCGQVYQTAEKTQLFYEVLLSRSEVK